MASKKTGSRANAYLSILTLLIALTAIGIASQQWWHKRLDLTRDGQFTLSRAAVKTLEGLPDLVTVKVVMSKDLPTQFIQIRTAVTDLLEEFQARSDGKLNVIYEDPGADSTKQRAATALGVQEVVLQEQTSEGMEVKKGFFGLALLYGNKKEVIPVLQSLENFEYDLVVRLKKLTGSVKTIGVVEGALGSRFSLSLAGQQTQTTTGFDENFRSLKEMTEKLYKVETVDAANKVPETVDLLLVAAPTRLTEREKYHIDQFLMRGKSAIFLTPGIDVNLGTGISGTPANNNYDDLLSHFGLSVKKDVILEPANFELVRFGQSFFMTPYPYWIRIGYEGMSGSSPMTSQLPMVRFPWASTVDVDTVRKDSTQAKILIQSSPESWSETGSPYLLPKDLKEYLPVDQKPHPIAAIRSGQLESFYAKRPVPQDSLNPIDTTGFRRESDGESRILVIANALFATDFFVGYTQAVTNQHLLLNAFDQLALDPDLITIRSREISDAPIEEPKKAEHKLTVLLLNLVGAPGLLLIIGLLMFFRKRKREAAQ